VDNVKKVIIYCGFLSKNLNNLVDGVWWKLCLTRILVCVGKKTGWRCW